MRISQCISYRDSPPPCIQIPSGERLKFGDESFSTFEDQGLKEARNSAFVLVAGGLGERLGYSGIKVSQGTN